MRRLYRILTGSLVLILITLSAVAPVAADGPAETRGERAELRFLQGMIDHHQMALDMAMHCLARATTDPVRELCQDVIDAQTAEIYTMRGWLLAWYHNDYRPMSMMHSMGGEHAHGGDMMGMMDGMMGGMMEGMPGMMPGMMEGHDHGAMPGMGPAHDDHAQHQDGALLHADPVMMMGMMAGLGQLSGRAYEIAWLEAMIDHHDDALHMSSRILDRAVHDELRTLAEQIIADQTAEIAAMEALIEELGG